MRALKNVINHIKNRIPKEVLNLAFMKKVGLIGKVTNIDTQIETLVIRPTVLSDINLIKGMTYTIPLEKCKQYSIMYNETANYMVIEVPYSLTGNKEIIDALSMTYSPVVMNSMKMGFNNNPGLSMASRAMDAVDSNAVMGMATSNLQLIGPNTILVHDNIIGSIGGNLRISVENDVDFKNLRPKSVMAFRELCLHAVKGYIYNELVVELGEGYIYGGHELGKVTDIVDKFEDAWDDYDEFLRTKMRKVLFINDSEANSRYLKMAISSIT
jgi:hypothetical protein